MTSPVTIGLSMFHRDRMKVTESHSGGCSRLWERCMDEKISGPGWVITSPPSTITWRNENLAGVSPTGFISS